MPPIHTQPTAQRQLSFAPLASIRFTRRRNKTTISNYRNVNGDAFEGLV
jgi:hypothetical protein